MKVLSPRDEQAHSNAVIKGALVWCLTGVGIGGAAVYAANRRFAGFRSLTLPIKVALVTTAGLGSFMVGADHASLEYTRKQYGEFEPKKIDERRQTNAYDLFMRNRYKFVAGTWVAGIAGSIAYVWNDKYMTTTQKAGVVRVWAQGITIVVLVAVAAMSGAWSE